MKVLLGRPPVTWSRTLALVAGGLVLWAFWLNSSFVGRLRHDPIVLVGARGQPWKVISRSDPQWRHLDDVSLHLRHAILAAEDNRFYHHSGIDWEEVYQSIRDRMLADKPLRGASTLTQQLVRSILQDYGRTWGRKAYEAMLALTVDARFPKDTIFELYLNVAYFGLGNTGVEQAAQSFFARSASQLAVDEAIWLAVLLPHPSERAPALRRRQVTRNMVAAYRTITERMRQLGYLSPALAQTALRHLSP